MNTLLEKEGVHVHAFGISEKNLDNTIKDVFGKKKEEELKALGKGALFRIHSFKKEYVEPFLTDRVKESQPNNVRLLKYYLDNVGDSKKVGEDTYLVYLVHEDPSKENMTTTRVLGMAVLLNGSGKSPKNEIDLVLRVEPEPSDSDDDDIGKAIVLYCLSCFASKSDERESRLDKTCAIYENEGWMSDLLRKLKFETDKVPTKKHRHAWSISFPTEEKKFEDKLSSLQAEIRKQMRKLIIKPVYGKGKGRLEYRIQGQKGTKSYKKGLVQRRTGVKEENPNKDIIACVLSYSKKNREDITKPFEFSATKGSILAIKQMLLEITSRIVSVSSQLVHRRRGHRITKGDILSAFSLICRYKDLVKKAERNCGAANASYSDLRKEKLSLKQKAGLVINVDEMKGYTRSWRDSGKKGNKISSESMVTLAAVIQTICLDIIRLSARERAKREEKEKEQDFNIKIHTQDILVALQGRKALFKGHVPWAGNPSDLHTRVEYIDNLLRRLRIFTDKH
jgi:hypothetical protein